MRWNARTSVLVTKLDENDPPGATSMDWIRLARLVRPACVLASRRAMAAGLYDSEQILDETVDRLVRTLLNEPR